MNFNLELPINPLSFGQVSTALLREMYARDLKPNLFTIGNTDLSSQVITTDFDAWLRNCAEKALKSYKRSYPTLKLWHFNGSHYRLSDKQSLLTFFECDNPTEIELNICRNSDNLILTSKTAVETFKEFGIEHCHYVPLGFDHWNFQPVENKIKDRVVWFLGGKLEITRKRTLKVLQNWVKKYGNNRDHFLHCAIYNPFLKPEDQQNIILQALGNKRYWNVQFFPFLKTNSEYNSLLNASHIVLGLSGSEGFDLPVFTSVALGKHCLALKAHVYTDYLNDKSAVFINPSSKIPVYDGIFFQQGAPFNQGNVFDWDEDDFAAGCDTVLKRFTDNPVNVEGLKLQNDFTYSNTVDKLLSIINQ